MKKSTIKLGIRRETLRMLAGTELVLIVGGGQNVVAFIDTENPETGCPLVQAAAQPAKP
jgi:hypothetical protein